MISFVERTTHTHTPEIAFAYIGDCNHKNNGFVQKSIIRKVRTAFLEH